MDARGLAFRELAESLPQLVWTITPDGATQYVSSQWVLYASGSGPVPAVRAWTDQVHPDDRVHAIECMTVGSASGIAFQVEFRIRRHDGVYRWFETRVTPLHDADGKVVEWACVATDVHLRDDGLGDRLRTAEQHAMAQAVAGVGSWCFDVASGEVEWSEQLFRIVGVEGRVAPNYQQQASIFAPASWAQLTRAVAHSIATGEGYELELELIRPDGERRWTTARAQTHRDALGKVIQLVGTLQDVTELALARSARDRANERMLLATSATKVGIWDWDIGADVMVWDETMYSLYGVTRDSGEGTYALWKNGLHPDDVTGAHSAVSLAIAGEQPFDTVFRVCHPDGGVRYIRGLGTVQRDASGVARRMLGVNWDVTPLQTYEDSLREAMHSAEQANRAKSEFLANMSHEIRTPMNAVIGLSYLLGQTALDEPQKALLAKVDVASKSLLVVLNNVLDLSKIEAGELIVERTTFSLRRLLGELADVMRVAAEAKRITFEIDAPDDLPGALDGDATRVSQILINLLSNAIKFTADGGVKLRVRALASTSERLTLCFAVQDTGIGIAPDVQALVFAPFAQADASITRRFGGTGLGLSIVRRLVNLMGGEMSLESTPGVGSEFKVVLDFALASSEALALLAATPAVSDGEALLGVRVLVVDDSDINLDVTQQILELEGAQVWLASNGQEAFEFLQAQPLAIDVVLMDVQMPVLDGHDATRRIRLELKLEDLPIIALTAGALSSERQRAAAAGMDDYIVKPFAADALVARILCRLTPANHPLEQREPASGSRVAGTTDAWPELNGIDHDDVFSRLSGDFGLFCSMLTRLLEEFSELAIPSAGDDPSSLSVQRGRLHKLKGSAGMLGAKEIQQLAGEAELACAAREIEQASELSMRLAAHLHRLRDDAALALARVPMRARPGRVAECAELAPHAVAELIDLLRRQSLVALDRFTSMSAGLRRLLGNGSYECVRDHLDNLRFAAAAEALSDASDKGSRPS